MRYIFPLLRSCSLIHVITAIMLLHQQGRPGRASRNSQDAVGHALAETLDEPRATCEYI
jgi:hypothetical protein